MLIGSEASTFNNHPILLIIESYLIAKLQIVSVIVAILGIIFFD